MTPLEQPDTSAQLGCGVQSRAWLGSASLVVCPPAAGPKGNSSNPLKQVLDVIDESLDCVTYNQVQDNCHSELSGRETQQNDRLFGHREGRLCLAALSCQWRQQLSSMLASNW